MAIGKRIYAPCAICPPQSRKGGREEGVMKEKSKGVKESKKAPQKSLKEKRKTKKEKKNR
jgi:hypothetical protein